MSTQSVSPQTVADVLDSARKLTEANDSFTVAEVVLAAIVSETTARAAVAQLITEGAVVKAEGRGKYAVVTTDTKPVEATVEAEVTPEPVVDVQPAPVQPIELDTDQDPSHAGLGYHVYAVGAGDQALKINRGATWLLTTDEELASFKSATELPVSGWSEDGKRRAVKELRVYVTGSPLTATPVFVAKPQELKKARAAGSTTDQPSTTGLTNLLP